MSARSSGSAIISFSLITVPVKLFLAASSNSFSFNMITKNGNRVKQKLVDSVTEDDVERTECDKGYEFAKDQYVVLTDDELKSLEGAKSNTIEVSEFVEDTNFDPRAVEKCYYLAPDKGAERPYRLLSAALADMKKIAVGKYYCRGRDHLVALRPVGDSLVLFQMYYANEIRPFEYSFSSALAPNDQELALAKQLVSKFVSDRFDITKYNDQYAERVREVIERKRAGEKIEALPPANSAPAMDLLTLLKASLDMDNKSTSATNPIAAIDVAAQVAASEASDDSKKKRKNSKTK